LFRESSSLPLSVVLLQVTYDGKWDALFRQRMSRHVPGVAHVFEARYAEDIEEFIQGPFYKTGLERTKLLPKMNI
jgi:hypothetical protein